MSSVSNLKSAKQAIKAELDHAREGLAFYQSRVEALQEALNTIDSVDTAGANGRKAPKAAVEAPAAKQPKTRGKGRPKAVADEEKLPSTGKEFWPNLITAQPRSAPEILRAAIDALGISPSKEQTKKLAQRQASALSILTKSGAVQSSGAGRERRFFK